jgi:predicted MFS family arabinose efflux permease
MNTESKRIYYGWFITAAAGLGLCFGYAGSMVYSFSSFMLPLHEEFAWARRDIGLAFSFMVIAVIIMSPIMGVLLDKFGARRCLLVGTSLFGISLSSMYFLSGDIRHYYLMFFILGLSGTATTAICYSRLLVSWFDKKKGWALGLALTGTGIGAMIIPPLVQAMIEAFDWRSAYFLLGLINLVIVGPILFKFVFNTPAEKNTFPDGVSAENESDDNKLLHMHRGFSFRQCMRQSVFWKLLIGIFIISFAQAGPFLQLIPILRDVGLDASVAASTAALLGVALIGARLLCGYLMDRMFAPYIASAFLAAPIFGFILFSLNPNIWTAVIMTISLGLAYGAEFDILGFFCSQYFGRPAFGTTYGIMFAVYSGAVGLAAPLAGWSFDRFGSYLEIFQFGALGILIGVGLIVTLGPYPELPLQDRD